MNLDDLNEAKRSLAIAWLKLAAVEAPPDATGPNEYMTHARDKLCTVLNNVEVLRARAGADRSVFLPGDVVLFTIEGITGKIRKRGTGDTWIVDYWTNRWVRAHFCQLVNLSR